MSRIASEDRTYFRGSLDISCPLRFTIFTIIRPFYLVLLYSIYLFYPLFCMRFYSRVIMFIHPGLSKSDHPDEASWEPKHMLMVISFTLFCWVSGLRILYSSWWLLLMVPFLKIHFGSIFYWYYFWLYSFGYIPILVIQSVPCS